MLSHIMQISNLCYNSLQLKHPLVLPATAAYISWELTGIDDSQAGH